MSAQEATIIICAVLWPVTGWLGLRLSGLAMDRRLQRKFPTIDVGTVEWSTGELVMFTGLGPVSLIAGVIYAVGTLVRPL